MLLQDWLNMSCSSSWILNGSCCNRSLGKESLIFNLHSLSATFAKLICQKLHPICFASKPTSIVSLFLSLSLSSLFVDKYVSLYTRKMDYIEHGSYNTFYPFQNKLQIHCHLQIDRLLRCFTLNNQYISETYEMG